MPRQGRIDISGCVYHVIGRGINRELLFKDEFDRQEFITRFSAGLLSTGTHCFGWALMPNHFHLLVRRGKKPLGELMKKILTGYAVYFNRKHKRRGYLFQNRYKSILCQEDKYLLELVRYIHLNPVRAGIVRDVEALRRYPWSGYAELAGEANMGLLATAEILQLFCFRPEDARAALHQFMKDGVRQGKRDDLTGGGLRRSAGGWSEVQCLKKDKEYWRSDERILGESDFVDRVLKEAEDDFEKSVRNKRNGYTFEYLLDRVSDAFATDKNSILAKKKKDKAAEAKAVLVYTASRELCMSGTELARRLSCSPAAVSLLKGKGEIITMKKKLNLTTKDRPPVVVELIDK